MMNACQLYVYVVIHALCLVCVIGCGITHGNWKIIEMMLIYCYDYNYICIVLIWLILGTRYPPLN